MLALYILLLILSLVVLWFIFYIICSLLVNTKKEYTENSAFYRGILNYATLVACIVLRIKIKIVGKDKLSPNSNYLFVSNHRSNLDPIISWYIFKEHNIAFISKPENFKVPIFGNIIHRCCFLPIDRTDPFKAIETINKASSLLKSGKMSVGVYPEGTRNTNDTLLPFHNGVFRIAQKAHAPIAVVAIKNADKVSKNFPFRRTKIHIEVIEIIPSDELKGKRTDIIGDRIRSVLSNSLQ